MQALSPAADAYHPASHAVQALEAVVEAIHPAEHSAQALSPEALAYHPLSHATHALEAEALAMVPGAQVVGDVEPTGQANPASHTTWTDGVAHEWPTRQGVWTLEPAGQ